MAEADSATAAGSTAWRYRAGGSDGEAGGSGGRHDGTAVFSRSKKDLFFWKEIRS
jgi:hypothetical protein